MATPNFFIVGPPKCATTSLAYYLKQHPDIFISDPKETRFFDLEYKKGIEFYERTYFAEVNYEKAVGEATATYTFLPYVAERIKKHYPSAKLLFCFRDPTERAFSEWLMHKSMGREPLAFRESIEENELNFVSHEGTSGAHRYETRCKLMRESLRQNYRVYIQSGLYGQQLQTYFALFPLDQIYLVNYSTLKTNPKLTLKSIYNFLNVDSDYQIPSLAIKNPYSFKKMLAAKSYSILGADFARGIWHIVPKRMRKSFAEYLDTKKAKKPIISDEDRLYTSRIFSADQRKFYELIKLWERESGNNYQ